MFSKKTNPIITKPIKSSLAGHPFLGLQPFDSKRMHRTGIILASAFLLATGCATSAPSKKPATALAQAVSVAQDPELAALPRVSLVDKVGADGKVEAGLLTLDRETELNGQRTITATDSISFLRQNGWWSTTAHVTTETTDLVANAYIGVMSIDGKLTPLSVVDVMANGEGKARIQLADLARLWRKANEERAVREGRVGAKDGKPLLLDSERELRFVKLVVETNTDKDGEYIGVSVVPVDKPNGRVRSDVPILFVWYEVQSGKVFSQQQVTN